VRPTIATAAIGAIARRMDANLIHAITAINSTYVQSRMATTFIANERFSITNHRSAPRRGGTSGATVPARFPCG
jgi:hypothetical protein